METPARMKAVVGIDPGKGGYLVMLGFDGSRRCAEMPVIRPAKGKSEYDVSALVRILREWDGAADVTLAVIEKQQAYHGQGSTSNFTTGFGYGILVAAATALGWPVECPHPKTWKAEMLRDIPGAGDDKARSILAAGRLFPGADLRRTISCRKPDDNVAEALLLAEWGRRRLSAV